MVFPASPKVAVRCLGLLAATMGGWIVAAGAQDAAEPPPTIHELLGSSGVQAGLYEHFQTDRYGFVLLKSGVVVGLHDAQGNVLVDRIGDWVLQLARRDEDGKISHSHAGMLREPQTITIIDQAEVDGVTQFEVQSEQRRVRQTLTILCLEEGPKFEYEWEIIDFDTGDDGTLGIAFSVPLNVANIQTEVAPHHSHNPAMFDTTDGGVLAIGYNSDGYAPYGNGGLSVYRPGSRSVGFYPKFSDGPVPGSRDSLTLTFEMP